MSFFRLNSTPHARLTPNRRKIPNPARFLWKIPKIQGRRPPQVSERCRGSCRTLPDSVRAFERRYALIVVCFCFVFCFYRHFTLNLALSLIISNFSLSINILYKKLYKRLEKKSTIFSYIYLYKLKIYFKNLCRFLVRVIFVIEFIRFFWN